MTAVIKAIVALSNILALFTKQNTNTQKEKNEKNKSKIALIAYILWCWIWSLVILVGSMALVVFNLLGPQESFILVLLISPLVSTLFILPFLRVIFFVLQDIDDTFLSASNSIKKIIQPVE